MPNWTSLFSDNFNRADGGLNLGSWVAVPTMQTCQIVSNQIQVSAVGVDAGDYYSGVTPNADQYATIRAIAANAASNRFVGAIARCSTVDKSLYGGGVRGPLGASATLEIFRVLSGTTASLITATATVNSGDLLSIEAIGSTLNLYLNGVFALTANDTNLTTGFPGVLIYTDTGVATDAVGDDFDCGNAFPAAAAMSLNMKRERRPAQFKPGGAR